MSKLKDDLDSVHQQLAEERLAKEGEKAIEEGNIVIARTNEWGKKEGGRIAIGPKANENGLPQIGGGKANLCSRFEDGE